MNVYLVSHLHLTSHITNSTFCYTLNIIKPPFVCKAQSYLWPLGLVISQEISTLKLHFNKDT